MAATHNQGEEMMDYSQHHQDVIAGATMFVACEFSGRATYRRAERKTQQAAERAARGMIAARPTNDIANKGRPVLVYAVRGPNQVVAATVFP